eukprot:scaffold243996_cov40-Tisochrysis_lutea.AAC.5
MELTSISSCFAFSFTVSNCPVRDATSFLAQTQDELGQCGWTVVDALYFSVVTISTVGYGDLTPSDPGMKVRQRGIPP